jgi:hypothetical protein
VYELETVDRLVTEVLLLVEVRLPDESVTFVRPVSVVVPVVVVVSVLDMVAVVPLVSVAVV